MNDGTVSAYRGRFLAHLATAVIAFGVALLILGDRGGIHRPGLAQIPRRSPAPPTPAAPADEASRARPEREFDAQTPPPPEDVLKDLDPEERTNIRVYNATNKGVVNITTEAEGSGFFGDETSTGTGSGFVIDKQGRVLTNYHVIQGATTVRVTLFDGSGHEAQVIGADASNDVAVLVIRVPADKLWPLALGDSSKLMVGQKILALGNPFGLERTLTSGIISSLDRSLKAKNGRTIRGIIQTDAAINPGNSGGPLLNSKGLVIGMNTAIVSNVGQSAGISFAVPINAISRILRQLIENGHVVRADIGITKVYSTGQGLLVLGLEEGGPADRAGIHRLRLRMVQLEPGVLIRRVDPASADMIVAVEHVRVKTVDELLAEVERHRPGEAVRITVVRDGKAVDIKVTLGES
jgi:S1-C subfamily serine protease